MKQMFNNHKKQIYLTVYVRKSFPLHAVDVWGEHRICVITTFSEQATMGWRNRKHVIVSDTDTHVDWVHYTEGEKADIFPEAEYIANIRACASKSDNFPFRKR